MKAGETVDLEINGRQVPVAYQGKRAALRWSRLAYMHQLANAKELDELRKEYPADVVPELHDGAARYKLSEVAALLEQESPEDPVAWLREQGSDVDQPQPPGQRERELEFMLAVLEPTVGEDLAAELLEVEGFTFCFILAATIMRMHSLDAKAPRSSGLPVDESAGSAPPAAGPGSAQPDETGALGAAGSGAV